MDLKKDISNMYSTLLSSSIDNKQLQYWYNLISNDAASLMNLEQKIKGSQEYKNHIQNLYKEVYNNFHVDETFDEKKFEIYLKLSNEHNNKNMIDYITSLQSFDIKYTKYVSDIFRFEMNRCPSDKELEFFITNAKNSDVLYTSNMLSRHISSIAENMSPPPYNEMKTHANNVNVTDNSINNTDENTSDLIFNIEYQNGLDAFEDVFGRPMFVQEFFKYLVESKDNYNWDEVLKTHMHNFNRLRTIFQNFTGKQISEYYFVKKYINVVENYNFFQNIIDDIVNSVEYKDGMMEVIRSKYSNMYDQDLDDVDVEYIFAIIKNKKIDIVNDELGEILTQLKEETDSIISTIFSIYKNVLHRPPDICEIEKFTEFYRKKDDAIVKDQELERILINTLEFHDILKLRIRELYKSIKGVDIIHSALYEILNRLLVGIKDINMINVDETIRKIIP